MERVIRTGRRDVFASWWERAWGREFPRLFRICSLDLVSLDKEQRRLLRAKGEALPFVSEECSSRKDCETLTEKSQLGDSPASELRCRQRLSMRRQRLRDALLKHQKEQNLGGFNTEDRG